MVDCDGKLRGYTDEDFYLGNLKQLFNLDAWGFLREIATYGKVVRILGLFGVSRMASH